MGRRGKHGPLAGVRVLEIASLAPAPFAACALADMGADVVRVDRIADRPLFGSVLLDRGKRSITVDLKRPEGVELVLDLVAEADMLIEGFRPGVMERLGLGPDVCLARRPQLVYGRMTGFGQDGPMALEAGHDIDYIALSGALARIGRAGQPPTPPLNLVGDFGGGSMFLLFGMLCALREAGRSGQGQVVDASMVEGASYLMMPFFASSTGGQVPRPAERGRGLLDSGAPFYDAYETADGRYVAVGAMEPQFYAALVDGLGLAGDGGAPLPQQFDAAAWPAMKERIAAAFRTRTRAEWEEHFRGRDACVAPVLDLDEVAGHPQHVARDFFQDVDGVVQPGPAPRLSRTPGEAGQPPPAPGHHGAEILRDWLSIGDAEAAKLREAGVVGA